MFDGDRYEVRQKVGIRTRYNVYEDGEHVMSAKQKSFKLKEDFRFTTPDGDPLLRLTARQMMDVAATYDLVDERTGETVGSIKRDIVSVLRHEWELRDADGEVVARAREDNVWMALARRYLSGLIPFQYDFVAPDGTVIGEIGEQFSLRDKYDIDLSGDRADRLDPRLAVVAAVTIDAIEGN